MKGGALDAGALIGFEKNKRAAVIYLRRALGRKQAVVIPAAVLAQVWRDGSRQVRLSRLLESEGVEVAPLDALTAKAIGQICGKTGTSDVVDASVVLCARLRGLKIVTSDPDDLRAIDPAIELVVV